MPHPSLAESSLLLCAIVFGGIAQAAVLPEAELLKGAKQIEAACLSNPAQLRAPFVKPQDYPSVCSCIGAKSVEQLRHVDVPDGSFMSIAGSVKAVEAGKAAGAICLQPAFRVSIERTLYQACLAHNPNFSVFDSLPENRLQDACNCASTTVGNSLTLDKVSKAQARDSKGDALNQLLAETINLSSLSCMKQ